MKIKHEKGLCCFTLILFILYMAAGVGLTSCGTKEDTSGKAAFGNEASQAWERTISKDLTEEAAEDGSYEGVKDQPAGDYLGLAEANSSRGEEGALGSVPEPPADYKAYWGYGIYYSSISYEAVCEYFGLLKEEGWYTLDPAVKLTGAGRSHLPMNLSLLSSSEKPMVTELPVGSTQLLLSDGQDLLQMIVTIDSKSYPMNNSMCIRLEEGISDTYLFGRKDALSYGEALRLIQPEVDRLCREGLLSERQKKVTGLFELFVKDAYELMGLQAYTAVSDGVLVGSFLICQGKALPVKGFLEEACVADIDENGSFELLDLYGFGSGIYRIELSIYEFGNPVYYSSLTEVLHKKYANCFIPEKGYGELRFLKIDNSEVRLIGKDTENGKVIDHGRLILKDFYPVPERMEDFPYKQWKDTFDQSRLPAIDKTIPEDAPEIIISIDGNELDYIVTKTRWGESRESYDSSDLFRKLKEQEKPIPIYSVNGILDASKQIELNFGNSIPDSIQVKDAMMEENGGIRYGSRMVMDREVEILDNSRVQLGLLQHMAYYLSSNMADYEKNWYRMFHVICTWEDKEAVYSFLINTDNHHSIFEAEE